MGKNQRELPKRELVNFENGEAKRIVLKEPLEVERAYGGGDRKRKARKIGSYLTGDDLNNKKIARQRLAIKQEWGNPMTKKVKVTIPEGTVIWKGKAASQTQKNGKVLQGGGDQIWVDYKDQSPSWYGKPTRLK